MKSKFLIHSFIFYQKQFCLLCRAYFWIQNMCNDDDDEFIIYLSFRPQFNKKEVEWWGPQERGSTASIYI